MHPFFDEKANLEHSDEQLVNPLREASSRNPSVQTLGVECCIR